MNAEKYSSLFSPHFPPHCAKHVLLDLVVHLSDLKEQALSFMRFQGYSRCSRRSHYHSRLSNLERQASLAELVMVI